MSDVREEPREKDQEKEKGRKEEEEALVIPRFNADIFSKILIKCPIESLEFKFRYVSKSWDNIISSRNFRSQHLDCSKPEPGLIIQDFDEHGYGTYFINMKAGMTKLQPFKTDNCCKILGCSNGLALVEFQSLPHDQNQNDGCRDIWVANLVTNQYFRLPHHQPCSDPSLSFRTQYGFAFVPSIGKFKVICLPKPQDEGRPQCMILTLDCPNPEWRVIEGPAAHLINCLSHRPATSINGHIYWYFHLPYDTVLKMDLIEEKFSEVLVPYWVGNLVEFEGYLSNIVCLEIGQLDIWILKDVHEENWVKQHSINCHSRVVQLPGKQICKQIVSMRNGEITIFDYSDKMMYTYDVKLNELKEVIKVDFSGAIQFCSSHVNSYIFDRFLSNQ